MASEIRVNKINSRTGVGTITLSPTGVDFTGIATVATLKATTGIVTTLSATGNATVGGTLNVTGETTFATHINLGDNDKAIFGAGDDLQIYHDGSNSVIKDNGTGKLIIDTDGAAIEFQKQGLETIATFNSDGAVDLYHNNSKKFETTGVGASVTGTFNVGTGTSITSSSLIVNDVQYPDSGPLSNRNLVVNGAFQVDQRNSGGSITCSSGENKYAADRAKFLNLGTGELVLTLQQVTDAPAGFRHSNKVTVTTAESSGATPAANDRASMQMRLEGNTVESLALGTSDAKDFVVSFYVKSSLTGNFGVAFVGSNRSYPVLYNIASAGTWERKVIKIPGPTDGTWNTGSSEGLALKFGLYTGADRDGPDQGTDGTGTWQTNATPQGVENQVQIGGTGSATWQITGVQLEVGEKATPFEHRSFGDELARCQRYYQELDLGTNNNVLHMVFSRFSNGTGNPFAYTCFPVAMRAAPSFSFLGSTFDSSGYTGDPSLGGSTINGAQLNGGNSASANNTHFLRPNNGSGDYLRLTFASEF